MNTIDTSKALFDTQIQKQPKIDPLTLSKDDQKLREQTDAFEAILVKTLLDTAMKMDDTLYPKAPGHEIYDSMYREHMSQALSGGFGYSDALFAWLKEEQNIAENGGVYKPEHLQDKGAKGKKEE